MASIAGLMREREIPFEVSTTGGLPILSALACPYPELAKAGSQCLHDGKTDVVRNVGRKCAAFGVPARRRNLLHLHAEQCHRTQWWIRRKRSTLNTKAIAQETRS